VPVGVLTTGTPALSCILHRIRDIARQVGRAQRGHRRPGAPRSPRCAFQHHTAITDQVTAVLHDDLQEAVTAACRIIVAARNADRADSRSVLIQPRVIGPDNLPAAQ
jgi:hypothetical protein